MTRTHRITKMVAPPKYKYIDCTLYVPINENTAFLSVPNKLMNTYIYIFKTTLSNVLGIVYYTTGIHFGRVWDTPAR